MRLILKESCWFVALLAGFASVAEARDEERARLPTDPLDTLRVLEPAKGVRFGLWGPKPALPAPTLFVFASTIEGTLGNPYYRQCGDALAKRGFLCVSMDLPCHGSEKRPDEPAELAGWRHRIEHGEPFVEEFRSKLSQVLDYLIAKGWTDPAEVAACGTSRGGFIALHWAGSEPRIRCVAAFAPVTDLGTLHEFKGLQQHPAVRVLALINHVDRLAGRPVWVVIGDQDQRVNTDSAIAFARGISAASAGKNVPSRVELHVLPEPRGHTTPDGASEQAANWIAGQVK